jgi:hypothetical protein
MYSVTLTVASRADSACTFDLVGAEVVSAPAKQINELGGSAGFEG